MKSDCPYSAATVLPPLRRAVPQLAAAQLICKNNTNGKKKLAALEAVRRADSSRAGSGLR